MGVGDVIRSIPARMGEDGFRPESDNGGDEPGVDGTMDPEPCLGLFCTFKTRLDTLLLEGLEGDMDKRLDGRFGNEDAAAAVAEGLVLSGVVKEFRGGDVVFFGEKYDRMDLVLLLAFWSLLLLLLLLLREGDRLLPIRVDALMRLMFVVQVALLDADSGDTNDVVVVGVVVVVRGVVVLGVVLEKGSV